MTARHSSSRSGPLSEHDLSEGRAIFWGRALILLLQQKLLQLRQSDAAHRDAVLFVRSHFRVGLGMPVRNEYRIITKSVGPPHLATYRPVYDTFEKLHLRAVAISDAGRYRRPSILNSVHQSQDPLRANRVQKPDDQGARQTPQRHDAHSGIIHDNGNAEGTISGECLFAGNLAHVE